MKEVNERIVIEIDAINPTTGEIFKLDAIEEIKTKYYSVSKITTRINSMDLFTTMEKVCTSSKDISTLKYLTELIGSDNFIRLDSITGSAKVLKISRVKLTKFMKGLIDVEFLLKMDTGIYFVNPFVYVGRRVRSNELRENAQLKWMELQSIQEPKENNK